MSAINSCPFLQLPADVQGYTYRFLSIPELRQASSACKRMRTLALGARINKGRYEELVKDTEPLKAYEAIKRRLMAPVQAQLELVVSMSRQGRTIAEVSEVSRRYIKPDLQGIDLENRERDKAHLPRLEAHLAKIATIGARELLCEPLFGGRPWRIAGHNLPEDSIPQIPPSLIEAWRQPCPFGNQRLVLIVPATFGSLEESLRRATGMGYSKVMKIGSVGSNFMDGISEEEQACYRNLSTGNSAYWCLAAIVERCAKGSEQPLYRNLSDYVWQAGQGLWKLATAVDTMAINVNSLAVGRAFLKENFLAISQNPSSTGRQVEIHIRGGSAIKAPTPLGCFGLDDRLCVVAIRTS